MLKDKKLVKTDAVDVIECFKDNFFVISDKGNFTVVKNNNTYKIEPYDGSLNEFLDDYEVSKPSGRKRCGYISDFFPGITL